MQEQGFDHFWRVEVWLLTWIDFFGGNFNLACVDLQSKSLKAFDQRAELFGRLLVRSLTRFFIEICKVAIHRDSSAFDLEADSLEVWCVHWTTIDYGGSGKDLLLGRQNPEVAPAQ